MADNPAADIALSLIDFLSDLPLQANTSPAVLITAHPCTADKPDYTISIVLVRYPGTCMHTS
ncbi:hypothetical protein DPMN_109047 [Dreissena polymorpha]|uniref:Uncharacterized protein n=1 Tax=Dreissena polymorpha TaxID=45954 RepID=A0A9D4K9K4_DREPO|nr:hypothetical protein DPMN_109047 [Dreissena polymorpha]